MYFFCKAMGNMLKDSIHYVSIFSQRLDVQHGMRGTHPEDEVLHDRNSQDLSTTMNMGNRMRAITIAKTARACIHSSYPDKGLAQRAGQLIGGLAVGLSLSLLAGGKAEAASFTFTKIADTSGPFNRILSGLSDPGPSINAGGTVAFAANLSPEIFGIYTGSGGSTTTITQGFISSISFYNPVINDSDTVAYGRTLLGNRVIASLDVESSNGAVISIASLSSRLFTSYRPVINNAGTVAFSATSQGSPAPGVFLFSQDISISSGNSTTTIARTSDLFFSRLGNPALNDSGTVAFWADPVAGGSGIFTSSGGSVATLIDSSGPFSSFRGTAINDSNTVAFLADLDAGGSGIFTSSGGAITTVADTSGPFSSFGVESTAINDSGTVAFLANLDAGGAGIFTGLDSVVDQVIATGDLLFGSTVTSLSFSKTGLNNSGQVAFFARLANGTEGIFRANPASEPLPPQSVPEPASVLGLLVSGALGVSSLRQRQNKHQS
jgi:hypothetical protein